jgi:transposase InsO family protein
MKMHANARLSVKGRELLVDRIPMQGWSLVQGAEAAGASDRTACKWVARYREEGLAGLADRSSLPVRQPKRTPEDRVAAIAALRRVRLTGAQIAMALSMPLSTVSGILTRIGLGKLSRLEPPEPPNRYERRCPGELIHIDVKKLGRIGRGAGHRVSGNRGPGQRSRGAGWEFVHVCVDDATRLAYVEVLSDEKAPTAVAFLRRATSLYRSHGVQVQRVMTDNGPAYRSIAHKIACTALGLRHLRTRPYRPRTNGGKQSASSARCSVAGPTARSTPRAPRAPPRCPAGWRSTTGDDHTAPSATSHPALAYTS